MTDDIPAPPTDDPLFARAVAKVLLREGGLVDDPSDPGKVTNFGISLAAYPELGADGIRALTVDRAKGLYWRDYWKPYRWRDLPGEIALKCFDAAVNMGALDAIRSLQRACWAAGEYVAEDGVLGMMTVGVAGRLPTVVLLAALKSELAAHYRLVACQHPTESKFLKGWLQRAYADP